MPKRNPQTKTARWLDLLAFLLNRRSPVTREEIWSAIPGYGLTGAEEEPTPLRIESARQMFERDKAELRDLGINIEPVGFSTHDPDETGVGYRLRAATTYLPYFELTGGPPPARPYQGLRAISVSPDDLRVLDRATARLAARPGSPFEAAARSLRRKLAFDLPLGGRAAERVLARPLAADTMKTLRLLQEAVAARRAVRCVYYAIGRDAREPREVEPWGLFFTWGLWYCVGLARDRAAVRVFRLERIEEVELLPDPVTVPPGFRVRDYLGRKPWELGDGDAVRAVVRFGFPEARWVIAQGAGEVVDDLLPDGGATLAFQVRESGPFVRWLLSYRGQAAVVEPEGIARELAALRSGVADVYQKRRAADTGQRTSGEPDLDRG